MNFQIPSVCAFPSLGFRVSFAIVLLIFYPAIIIDAQQWREVKGDHFIVYFEQDEKFAEEVLTKAEIYYREIALELGYQRYSGFWTWNNRVKIFIYPDRTSFLAATNQPAWSAGLANYKDKTIVSYVWSQGFTNSLLPHETAHLVFRDYVGFEGEVPLWLDEGVAQWMEPKKRQKAKEAIRDLIDQGGFMSLEGLLAMDIREVGNEQWVPSYYIEAVSLVGFLISEYGSENFIDFCRQLRDGKSFQEALKFSYPTSIRSIQELEEKWQSYIKRK